MKKNSILRNVKLLFFIALALLIFSCSKDSDKTTKDEQQTLEFTSVTGFTEANEDLFTVDYNYFYTELSPYGEWVEINLEALGLDMKKKSASRELKEYNRFMSSVLGVSTVYAQTSEELMNLFVWRPAKELISSKIDEQVQEYIPYTNGQWLNTDEGWYFKGENVQEEITSHYGRWTNDTTLGWVWLPGTVWSPAWVEWREDNEHIA
ncbi:MAG: hypothetical protein FJ216_00270 [Ignavibacteria bacterium]|nr:hypothetical protein [Ignavibacteria bacterium]